MNISEEAIEAAAEAISAQHTCDGLPYVTEFQQTLAREALEAAAPVLAAQVSTNVMRLARWLMDAEITDSLEVLDILAEGDIPKAIAELESRDA